MKHPVKEKWNQIYRENNREKPAIPVLVEHAFLLPNSGIALDMACGMGENACFLAQQGLATTAWDISEAAIAKLQQIALSKALPIKPEVHEITQNSFDVIIISRFLDRLLSDGITRNTEP